jgi:hypothetical protein
LIARLFYFNPKAALPDSFDSFARSSHANYRKEGSTEVRPGAPRKSLPGTAKKSNHRVGFDPENPH